MLTKRQISNIAIATLTMALSSGACADEYSTQFAEAHGKVIEAWGEKYDSASELNCKESRVSTIQDGTSSLSACLRMSTKQIQSEVGLYRFVNDIRAVANADRGYIVNWSELESNARISISEQPPQSMLRRISTNFDKEFTDWSRPKNYSAGFTRQFQGATAKNSEGKDCLILTGKRGKNSVLTVLTCGNSLPEKKELKAFLKTFS